MTHVSQETLRKQLDEARQLVEVGGRYAHYKHPEEPYKVIGLGFLEADDELAVMYEQEGGEHLTFIRPLKSFLEAIIEGGIKTPRFTKL